MNEKRIAYCGLSCDTCIERFDVIRDRIDALDEAFEVVNMQDVSKVIPFLRFRYRGYRKLIGFFREECPTCRDGGGNPFCSIRKCARKKGYVTCAECPDQESCGKFRTLYRVHRDNEIQTNIAAISAGTLTVQLD